MTYQRTTRVTVISTQNTSSQTSTGTTFSNDNSQNVASESHSSPLATEEEQAQTTIPLEEIAPQLVASLKKLTSIDTAPAGEKRLSASISEIKKGTSRNQADVKYPPGKYFLDIWCAGTGNHLTATLQIGQEIRKVGYVSCASGFEKLTHTRIELNSKGGDKEIVAISNDSLDSHKIYGYVLSQQL